MTKWELAELMGLELIQEDHGSRIYYSYAKTSRYNEIMVSWIVADNLEDAKEKAAEEYFDKLNHKCFV